MDFLFRRLDALSSRRPDSTPPSALLTAADALIFFPLHLNLFPMSFTPILSILVILVLLQTLRSS